MKPFSMTITVAGLLCIAVAGAAEARERALTELPGDVWSLATAWTEPIKQAAKYSQQIDPVSGVWFGLLDGSVKSVERAVEFIRPADKTRAGPEMKSGNALLRYTF